MDAPICTSDEVIEYPPCRICKKSHGMGVKNRVTGKIKPIDLCYDCFWARAFSYKPISDQVILEKE